jgi:hypothetical protein
MEERRTEDDLGYREEMVVDQQVGSQVVAGSQVV